MLTESTKHLARTQPKEETYFFGKHAALFKVEKK